MNDKLKKTKVLFVITKSNWGGAQKYVFDIATGLPRDKFDVSVALGGAGVLAEMLRGSSLRVISIPSLDRDVNPIKDLLSFFVLWKLFKDEQPDVVHLNSSKVGALGALAGRFALVPKIVFTAHAWAFNENRSPISLILIKIIAWMTIVLSHKTIAVSDAIKKSTNSWPLIKNKVVVIKNGVVAPKFLTQDAARRELASRANTTLPPDAFIIGTVAELHKNKGLSYAIEAFAKIPKENPNLFYFILGEGEEKEKLDFLIEERGLREHVFLLGFVKDAPQFLPAFDAFLLPSLTEALGLVLLEAGLAGLPIVASQVGGIPEVIEDSKTGILVPPRDSGAIKNALMQLIESSSLRTSLGTALRRKVLANFSLERVISETINEYIPIL